MQTKTQAALAELQSGACILELSTNSEVVLAAELGHRPATLMIVWHRRKGLEALPQATAQAILGRSLPFFSLIG